MPAVQSAFRREVIEGLTASPKRLPSKLFYDERGSKLFDEITQLDEYYPTRTEISILEQHLPEMAALIGPNAVVIEFGTGAGVKTAMLLEALINPSAYVPIDISREQLSMASKQLSQRFPGIAIYPICGDYTESIVMPSIASNGTSIIFFPGSTIGNFEPREGAQFLRRAASLAGPHGSLLIGFDRVKDRKLLEAAYNDTKGITAEFNLHLLERIAEEFDITLSTHDFEHYAFYNESESRIEMHLICERAQSFVLDGEEIHFKQGEHIITEYSYKYTPESFASILSSSGYEVMNRWTDPKEYFEVSYAIHR